jgi:dipeptidase D
LGADDGIGVAMALSVLQDKTLAHPRLQVLLTADEETGMFGANGVETDRFIGRKLINLDGEEEGIFIVGCAGGMRQICSVKREKTLLHGRLLTVKLCNLTGGHSGVDIGFGGANANKVMAEVLLGLHKEIGVGLIAFSGGVADNAIPAFATASVVVPEEKEETAAAFLHKQQEQLAKRFCATDSLLSLETTVGEMGDFTSFSLEDSGALFQWLCQLPNGVQTESKAFPGKPETSLNLGVVSGENDTLTATFSLRSFSESELEKLCARVQETTADFGGVTAQGASYPAWEYVGETPLSQMVKKVYKRQFGIAPTTDIIHAGLECGVFCGKVKEMQCVSFGPEMTAVHTPQEKVSLSSVDRTYAFLCALLAEKE